MSVAPVACVYTGAVLVEQDFVLDHFLPHAFVAHNRLWNLTPVAPRVNASKADRLPDLRFIERLASQHALLAAIGSQAAGGLRRTWLRAVDEFELDLKIGEAVLGNAEALAAAYRDTFGALAGIARRMGFRDGWSPGIEGHAND